MIFDFGHYCQRYGAEIYLASSRYRLKRGYVLQADYSQLENRIITLLSQDAVMTKLYDQNIDVHSYTAAELFGIPYEQFMQRLASKDPQVDGFRDMAKTVRFGMNYLGSAPTIWGQIIIKNPNVRLSVVEELCKEFRQLHAGIMAYHRRNMAFARENDYLEAPISGRRLYFHGKVDLNLLANWPIQTTGADVVNFAMLRWNEKRKRDIENGVEWRRYERLIGQVHDSMVLSTANPIGSALELKAAMETPVVIDGRPDTVFPIDLELGAHMGPDTGKKKDKKTGKPFPSDYGLRGVDLEDRAGFAMRMLECGQGSGILERVLFKRSHRAPQHSPGRILSC